MHGGQLQRLDVDLDGIVADTEQVDILALDEALTRLAEESPVRAELVKLRFFAGLTMTEAAAILRIAATTTVPLWYDSSGVVRM